MSGWWPRIRVAGGVALLLVVVWRVGTGPFLDGLRSVDLRALLAAAALGLVTTLCCAWRWRLVARGIGLEVPFGQAVASYYRSQLLNLTLPGGIVGDVHRGLLHGRAAGARATALRSVAWERAAGQAVQLVLTLVVLLVLPSPLSAAMPVLVPALLACAAAVTLVLRLASGRAGTLGRALQVVVADLRFGLLPRGNWPGVVAMSTVVVAGHTATFVLAARTAGVDAPLSTLVPLALLVLLGMAIPLSIGGWGPREGVAAWVFASAGLGAALGVSTAVVYGVLSLGAALPGVVVLVHDRRRLWRPEAVHG